MSSLDSPQTRQRSQPSVSVVIPTRDRPGLLRRAVESVRAQRYDGDIECVTVFDQSHVHLAGFGGLTGVTIRGMTNSRSPGLAGARNTGILAARGDLVAFCDDDDEWLPDKLASQVELLQKTGAATASCGIYVEYHRRHIARVARDEAVTLRDLLRSRRMELAPSTILVRRDAFELIGLIDEEIPGSYAEDYEWLLRAARVSPIVVVREPLARVHWHDSSYFVGQWEMIISALSYLLERYPEFRSDRVGLSRIFGQIAFASASCGRRADALEWAARALRLSPAQPRAYLALAVAGGLTKADSVLRVTRTFGRGI
jgi:glycosyltransferase involved in cell wall biosynthesis